MKLRVSTSLLLIILLLLAGVVANGLTAYLAERAMAKNVHVIDMCGLARGSLQRIVKLETNGIQANKAIAGLSQLINSFMNKGDGRRIVQTNPALGDAVRKFAHSWSDIKSLIYRYRRHRNDAVRRRLIQESETAWHQLGAAVDVAHHNTEERLHVFDYLFVITVVDILLFLVLVWMVRTYIRDQLENLAQRDPLTGLWNRHSFEVIGETLRRGFERNNEPYSLIMFDIDHFKLINDEAGHRAGDEVLRELGRRVLNRLRKGDSVCRVGGEEFVLLLPSTTLAPAVEVAEELRSMLAATPFLRGRTVTASFGVVEATSDEPLSKLIDRADALLYRAKRAGRNRVDYDRAPGQVASPEKDVSGTDYHTPGG